MNEKKWSLNSAVYHAVDGMLCKNNHLSYKIKYLLKGSAQRTSSILNEPRLRRYLYNQIQRLYNQRITEYGLEYHRLKDDGEDILDIKLYQPVEKDTETGEYKDQSGVMSIYPRSFYCNVCHDFIIINNTDAEKKVYSNKCQNKSCNGFYKQIPMLKFCNQCGKIDEIYYQCKCQQAETNRKAKKRTPLKFKWEKWDDPNTWKFECELCHKQEDFMKLPCIHKEYENGSLKKICSKKATKYSPMSLLAGQGGGPKPKVVTVVDIPPMRTLQHPKREKVLCAVIAGKLDFLKSKAESVGKSIIELVDESYSAYNNEINRKQIMESLKRLCPNKTQQELEKEYDNAFDISAIDKAIEEISSTLPEEAILTEIINFHSLKGTFTNELNSFSYKGKFKGKENIQKLDEIENIFKKYKLADIHYISNLRIISSCIGTVNGKTRSETEREFVPHFNPLWDYSKKRISAYCNPYNTEGILIEFDKKSVFEWIKKVTGKNIDLTPEEFFMGLKDSDETYKWVYKLLHTISHLLIKKSEVFTGIDVQSCGEMILPINAALLIYSTNTVNIGGFSSLFENGIIDLIAESDFEMRKCIYDPLCLINEGSCFSCMHLPEHVCCNFNESLDRDVLIGSGTRCKECFW
jgi:hypothetical protein